MSRFGAVLGLVVVAYAAGEARSANSSTVQKLNVAVDSIVKARSALDASSPSSRPGIAAVAAAKDALDKALEQTVKAVKAEGG